MFRPCDVKRVFSRCVGIGMVSGNTFVIQSGGHQLGILEAEQLIVRKRCEVWLEAAGRGPCRQGE